MFALLLTLSLFPTSPALAHEASADTSQKFVQIAAKDKFERSKIANAGVSIEAVRSDSIWGFANQRSLKELREQGFNVMGVFEKEIARGGHDTNFDFPTKDSKFHNFAEMKAEMDKLASDYSDITRLQSVGKSLENRDLWALHINTDSQALASGQSTKPGVIFMGQHHAREHVSLEVPLWLAGYLLKNRADAQISKLIAGRDIWIVPSVNPDGAEYDISTGRYKMWRKNRRDNGDGTFGVDLNRNYGHGWGTGGSSHDTSSDIYMGKAPFSEPETQVIRDFVTSQANTRVLLSFHTFSELVLYPWGGTNDPIANERDRKTFETMAKTMAAWNKYTPEQASDLYIASGDTTDWAYGEHGIFAFTFELSPKNSLGSAGFYPGQGVLDQVYQDNLRPCLYLMDVAGDPYQVLSTQPNAFLKSYVQPYSDPVSRWNGYSL